MAFDFVVQRLQVRDVILGDFPDQGGKAEATVMADIIRTDRTVRVALRVEGHDDFVTEWALDEMVTVVRGP